MKNVRYSVILFIALFFTISSYGQQLKGNEVVVIKGEKFILHQVRTGETIFSISRDFNVEQSQLIKNNPKISTNGLDIGEILQIPYNEGTNLGNVNIQKGDPTSFITHTIESRKETPYFIAKEYGITVEQLYAYNPEIKRYRKGTKVRIPQWGSIHPEKTGIESESQQTMDNAKDLVEHLVLSGETLYSIAKQFNVSVSELLFFNPEAKKLKAGSKIMIPVTKKEKEEDKIAETNISEGTANTDHYFEHVIESGETMWGITHKYDVTDDELIALNPVLQTGFPAGVVIKIPTREMPSVKSVDENEYSLHKVEPAETLYGLSREYHVPIDEIRRSNPVLANRGPVIGETLLIPKQTEQPIENAVESTTTVTESPEPVLKNLPEVSRTLEVPASCVPNSLPDDNKVYLVSLFLPLYLEANDTLNREIILPEVDSLALDEMALDTIALQDTIAEQDTTVEKVQSKEMFKRFYGNSENFLQFYEGVLVAIDSMQKSGLNVVLNVFDTQNNVDSTRAFLQTPAFRESDLIIGPVYQEIQKEVADAAKILQIPIVSPFASSSDVINLNPYFFQVNPSREYLAEKTAEMVVEDYYNNCNFIVVRTSNSDQTIEGKMVNLIREKYFNTGILNSPGGVTFKEYNFKSEGSFGLRSIMSKQKENVVLIPSSMEGELSIAISNINNLADDYSITLIATSNYQQRYPSIDVEQFHNLKMKYVYPYWVDYSDPATIRMIESFKQYFATEPNMFGMQGFDVTYYFLNALRYYGAGFSDCEPYIHFPLIQGNYHFQKVSQQGGFMNQGVSVISYTRDYNVVRQRVKGQPKLVAQNQ